MQAHCTGGTDTLSGRVEHRTGQLAGAQRGRQMTGGALFRAFEEVAREPRG
jgi:hypothetical protein